MEGGWLDIYGEWVQLIITKQMARGTADKIRTNGERMREQTARTQQEWQGNGGELEGE